MPGQLGNQVSAVGRLRAMPRVEMAGDSEQPSPGAAAAGVETAQRRDRLRERLRGEIGDGLRLGATAGEEPGDPGHVGSVERLELGQPHVGRGGGGGGRDAHAF